MRRKNKLYGCVRCMTYKPRDAFALPGPERKRMDSVCLQCREVERVERDRRAQAREARRTTREIDGVMQRRCPGCKQWKPLTLDFFYCSKHLRDGSIDFDYWCKDCQTARTTRRSKERRDDPLLGARERQMSSERTRRWRQRNPQAAAAAARRYKQKVKADRERYARSLESQRISYRLRKERQGEGYNESRQRATVINAHRPNANGRLPVDPLREWLEAVIAREGSVLELAQTVGVHERQLTSLRRREYGTVTLSVADTLLTRYGQPVRVNGFGPVEFLWDLYEELSPYE